MIKLMDRYNCTSIVAESLNPEIACVDHAKGSSMRYIYITDHMHTFI